MADSRRIGDLELSPEECPEDLVLDSNMDRDDKRLVTPTDLQEVLFVQVGTGCDQHGQDPTVAAKRACENAIQFNSIPSLERLAPSGINSIKVRVKIATPKPGEVETEKLKAVFPYGQTSFQVVEGGMQCHSGVIIPGLGDKETDYMIVAVAAVTVGY